MSLKGKNIKIVHVVPHLQEAAGPSYSVPRLCESISEAGGEVCLKCLSEPLAGLGIEVRKYSQISWVLPKFGFSCSLTKSLFKDSSTIDIIHNHSLWSMINIASGFVVPGRSAKYIVSPRGTLSKWALSHSKLKKFIFWPAQKRALRAADLIHATSYMEYEEIRDLGFRNPVAIIPNGIDIPKGIKVELTNLKIPKKLLFLSRVHKKKGIENLLKAWQFIQSRYPNWTLEVVGKGDDDYVRSLKASAIKLGLVRFELSNAIYGVEKSYKYYSSDLFILPSKSENFGMVVAEALAHGVPVITTRGTPWSDLQHKNCGWWVNGDVQSLIASLEIAMNVPDEQLIEMGLNGRNFMLEEFAWEPIGFRMMESYRWLLGLTNKPDYIYLD